jgi:hypothetical protein
MNSYREKLAPSWWMVASTALFVPATLLIFLPLSVPLGITVGVGLWLASTGVLWFFAPTIGINEKELRAGKARIDLRFISNMEIYRHTDATAQRGTQLDARAWLVLRPWVDPVVKISLNDPQDPTPYWLVSSRTPEKLVDAWRASQAI